MSFDRRLTPKKQIRNLLTLLVGGIVCALLLTVFSLYFYGPDGRYLIKNALLSPEIISQVKLNKSAEHDISNKIEFSYEDSNKKRITLPVDKKNYSQFYQLIAYDQSLLDVPEDIIAAFNRHPTASLMLIIQTNTGSQSDDKQIFQEVQILPNGDFYRLLLREPTMANWIYYHHPHIYQEAFNLFTTGTDHENER